MDMESQNGKPAFQNASAYESNLTIYEDSIETLQDSEDAETLVDLIWCGSPILPVRRANLDPLLLRWYQMPTQELADLNESA